MHADPLPRSYSDIEAARDHHAALADVFSRRRSPEDAVLASQVLAECWGAWVAVDNAHCRARIRMLVEYANALFAPREPGVPAFIKEQALNDKIRRMLDSYERWLNYLEAARNADADAAFISRPSMKRAAHAG